MQLDNLTKNLLEQIASLHDIPNGAISLRKNGKGELVKSTPNIEIVPKHDLPGVDVFVHSTCQKEACHLPVVVTDNGFFDVAYNDFYIEDGADVVIIAGCGVHSSNEGGHDGIHTFHIGNNAHVEYIENHVAIGKGTHKVLNPITNIKIGNGSTMIMNTTQLSGVDYSNRVTSAELGENALLEINEKILTSGFNVAKTDFKVKLKGKHSRASVVSRSVARDESEQSFKSNLIGLNACYGRVECDGIVLDSSRIDSVPKISARNKNAELSHEAAVGKIAGEQIVKLMTLGLTYKQAEDKIIESFLK